MKFLAYASLIGSAVVLSTTATYAQWPERPVTIVVSQAAGASPDIMARVMAEELSRKFGQPFIVDNRPGGGNVVGALSVAEAAPDGHTLFFATSAALVNNPYLLANLPYDTNEDFDAVALVALSNIAIVAGADTGINTMDDLIERARSEPGVLSIGVDSPRNLSGIIARSINHYGEIDLTLVSYNNITQAITDTISGVIPLTVQSVSVAAPYIADGSLTAVAVASAEPADALPDVPTISATLSDIELNGWFMFVTPEGTDPEILETLNAAVQEVTSQATVIEQAQNLGFELVQASVEESDAHLQLELENLGRVTTELGILPE